MTRRGVLLLLLLAGSLARGLVAGEHGVTIQAASPWNDPRGYTPVVVTAEADRDLALRLTVGDDDASAATTVRLAAGRAVRQTLLIPPSNDSSVGYRSLDWSGPGGISGAARVSDHGHQRTLCALIDPKQQVDLPALGTTLGRLVPSTGRSGARELVQRIMPEELPDRWQGYPDWLVLVLTPQGDAALDEAQRQAIAAWTRAGGTLVVNTATLQRAWQERHATAFLDPLTGDAGVLAEGITQQLGEESWQPLDAPVPGTEIVPVRTFVFLALAFAVVVGPLNLWWVRRRNARHLFLVTTPVLSFVTCVVLIVANLVADGVSIRRSAVQVGFLDQRTQQLVRWTGCTYFAAFARSQLELDAQARLRVLDRDDYAYRYRSRDGGQHLHLDWTAGQLASGTLLPARTNRQLAFTEHLPERRRLVVARSGDGYELVNGLGVEVSSFAWNAPDGRRWFAGHLPAGGSTRLEAVSPRVHAPLPYDGLDPDRDLPARIVNRIGREVVTVHRRVTTQPLGFSAVLATPLDALPGPVCSDPEPPEVMLFGHLPLGAVEGRP